VVGIIDLTGGLGGLGNDVMPLGGGNIGVLDYLSGLVGSVSLRNVLVKDKAGAAVALGQGEGNVGGEFAVLLEDIGGLQSEVAVLVKSQTGVGGVAVTCGGQLGLVYLVDGELAVVNGEEHLFVGLVVLDIGGGAVGVDNGVVGVAGSSQLNDDVFAVGQHHGLLFAGGLEDEDCLVCGV